MMPSAGAMPAAVGDAQVLRLRRQSVKASESKRGRKECTGGACKGRSHHEPNGQDHNVEGAAAALVASNVRVRPAQNYGMSNGLWHYCTVCTSVMAISDYGTWAKLDVERYVCDGQWALLSVPTHCKSTICSSRCRPYKSVRNLPGVEAQQGVERLPCCVARSRRDGCGGQCIDHHGAGEGAGGEGGRRWGRRGLAAERQGAWAGGRPCGWRQVVRSGQATGRDVYGAGLVEPQGRSGTR